MKKLLCFKIVIFNIFFFSSLLSADNPLTGKVLVCNENSEFYFFHQDEYLYKSPSIEINDYDFIERILEEENDDYKYERFKDTSLVTEITQINVHDLKISWFRKDKVVKAACFLCSRRQSMLYEELDRITINVKSSFAYGPYKLDEEEFYMPPSFEDRFDPILGAWVDWHFREIGCEIINSIEEGEKIFIHKKNFILDNLIKKEQDEKIRLKQKEIENQKKLEDRKI